MKVVDSPLSRSLGRYLHLHLPFALLFNISLFLSRNCAYFLDPGGIFSCMKKHTNISLTEKKPKDICNVCCMWIRKHVQMKLERISFSKAMHSAKSTPPHGISFSSSFREEYAKSGERKDEKNLCTDI